VAKKGSCPPGMVGVTLPNSFDGMKVEFTCKCFDIPKKKGNVLSEDYYSGEWWLEDLLPGGLEIDAAKAVGKAVRSSLMQAAEQNEAASSPCDKKASCPDGMVKVSLPNGFDAKTMSVQWSCKCFELPKKKGNVLSEDDYAEAQQPFQVQPQVVYGDYYQLAAPIQQMEAPPMVYR